MHNEAELRRLVNTVEAFLVAGVKAAVRITRRNLVKATPKRTQFAAGWVVLLDGAGFEQQDKPTKTIYPLPGDTDTAREMSPYQLGDEVALVSPATYIKWLDLLGNSPQADANFIQDTLEESRQQLLAWRWDGAPA